MTENEAALSVLLSRRSVSPRRLVAPGVLRAALNSLIGAALRGPDHGALVPWRVIEFPGETRPGLAHLFADEKARRTPGADPEDLERARHHATDSPTLLAFVFVAREHPDVPLEEQWLCAGAALGNLLMAAHASGFGAKILSGNRCRDESLCAALGLSATERLCGFIGIGTIATEPAERRRPPRDQVLSVWQPVEAAPRPMVRLHLKNGRERGREGVVGAGAAGQAAGVPGAGGHG
jgi:nitroreductase